VISEHLPLGTGYQPAARPSCAEVARLARVAGTNGVLVTVPRPRVTVIELAPVPYAAQLQQYGEDRRVVYLRKRTNFDFNVSLPVSGRYRAWLGGSFLSRLSLAVDGTTVATRRHELNWPGQFSPMGDVDLAAGAHRLTLTYAGPDAHPGSGGEPPFGTGPIVLSQATADLPLRYVKPAQARSLCGQQLDWIEALRG
jgi:hypothetical protein